MSHRISWPIRFGDCDPSGIAYFPAYMNILVGVSESFFEHIGFPWPELIRERNVVTPTVTLELDFVKPGYHGDMLDFDLEILRVGSSSVDIKYQVSNRGETLWTARQRLVLMSRVTHKSEAWPAELRQALLSYLET